MTHCHTTTTTTTTTIRVVFNRAYFYNALRRSTGMEYADEHHVLFQWLIRMDTDRDTHDELAAALDQLDQVKETHQKEEYPSLEDYY